MSLDEDLERKRHMIYYNQLLQSDRRAKLRDKKIEHGSVHEHAKKKRVSFGSQKVELRDYVIAPDGYEELAYIFYFLSIPYISGAIFLFLFVAGANFDNFMLLDLNSFLIVWLIGYEIVAAFLLFWIFIMFLQYEKGDDEDPYGFG